MDAHQELHVNRLRDSLRKIDGFLEGRGDVDDIEFKSWKDRTRQSLSELFGATHAYTRRFSSLKFSEVTMAVSYSPRTAPRLLPQNRKIFNEGMLQAKQLLTDALEEYSYLPPKPELALPGKPTGPSGIVVNVYTLLSQTTHVELSQVISNLNNLGLQPDQLLQAKQLASELEEEAKGKQRWPVLAKSLDALKSLGKSVYENVAIPLILEMLKNQTK